MATAAEKQAQREEEEATQREEAAKAAAQKVLDDAAAMEASNYADLSEAPEPMTMRVKATDPEQGEFILINTSDFDSAVHTPFDKDAERVVARRRARLRKTLNEA
jgi:hypothetical protein